MTTLSFSQAVTPFTRKDYGLRVPFGVAVGWDSNRQHSYVIISPRQCPERPSARVAGNHNSRFESPSSIRGKPPASKSGGRLTTREWVFDRAIADKPRHWPTRIVECLHLRDNDPLFAPPSI